MASKNNRSMSVWMILLTNHCYVMLQLIGELYGAMFRRRCLTDVIGQQKYIENNRSKNNGKDIRVDDLTDQSLLGYIEFDFWR